MQRKEQFSNDQKKSYKKSQILFYCHFGKKRTTEKKHGKRLFKTLLLPLRLTGNDKIYGFYLEQIIFDDNNDNLPTKDSIF